MPKRGSKHIGGWLTLFLLLLVGRYSLLSTWIWYIGSIYLHMGILHLPIYIISVYLTFTYIPNIYHTSPNAFTYIKDGQPPRKRLIACSDYDKWLDRSFVNLCWALQSHRSLLMLIKIKVIFSNSAGDNRYCDRNSFTSDVSIKGL